MSAEEDIFAYAAKAAAAAGEGAPESFALFLGSKGSGKSALVARCCSDTSVAHAAAAGVGTAALGSAGYGSGGGIVPSTAVTATVGLDYTFTRFHGAAASSLAGASAAVGGSGEGIPPGMHGVTHVWELGGSSYEKKLLDIPVTMARLPNNVVFVTVDLSCPVSSLSFALQACVALRARCDALLKSASEGRRGAAAPAPVASAAGAAAPMATALTAASVARVRLGWCAKNGVAPELTFTSKSSASASVADMSSGVRAVPVTSRIYNVHHATPDAVDALLPTLPPHPNEEVIQGTLFPVQIAIIGTKADALAKYEPTPRKTLVNVLRQVAVYFGAPLLFVNHADRKSLEYLSGLFANLCFGKEFKKSAVVDPAKLVYIPAGVDSLEAIALPSPPSPATLATLTSAWLATLRGQFPADGAAEEKASAERAAHSAYLTQAASSMENAYLQALVSATAEATARRATARDDALRKELRAAS